MKKPTKNCHYIPKLILKHWKTKNEENREGVYALESNKDQITFSNPTGQRAFSFAIDDYLYVPLINGERREELEDWFGSLENVLDKTIRRFNSDEISLFETVADRDKFVLAILSFNHRSKSTIETVKKFLKENPRQLEQITAQNNYQIDLVILENIVNQTTHDAAALGNFELVILMAKGEALIMGDRPFLENCIEGFSFLPLTNKIAIGIRKTKGQSVYVKREATVQQIASLNYMIASKAKYWLVAEDEDQLRKYEEEFQNNLDSEVEFNPSHYLRHGNTFRE